MHPWRSVHLFHSHFEHADLLALAADDIMRRVASDPGDWFFIRYAEGGPHIRVRIGGSNLAAGDEIRAQLQEGCARIAAAAANVPVSGYPDEQGRLSSPGEAVEIAYEPEMLRYGGPVAIREHERLFRASTAISISAIRRLPEVGQRARFALDLLLGTAVALSAAGYGSEPDFIRYYRANWRALRPQRKEGEHRPRQPLTEVPARLASLRTFLDERGRPGTLAQHWTHELDRSLSALLALHRRKQLLSPVHGRLPASASELEQAMFHMAFSQGHMLCNRLGIMPAQELAISEMLAASVH